MTAVVLALLGAWLLASAFNQIPGRWARFLQPLNTVGLLPRLHFFAPHPSDVDYHLVVRDFHPDGQAGDWHSVPSRGKGPLRMFWFPAKRDHEALMASVGGLASIQQTLAPTAADSDAVLQLSFPYLFLLHRARTARPPSGASHRQFMVVETSGFGATRRVSLGILSNPHRLSENDV